MSRYLITLALAAVQLTAEPVAVRGTVEYVRTIASVRDFTKPKSFLGKLGELVAGPPEDMPRLVRPYALTHDSNGRLLIADPGQGVVHIYDFERNKYQHLKGPRKERFRSPVGVATDADDNIYVSDSARARIDVFDRRGKWMRTLGRQFARPTGLAFDQASQSLFVADTLRHQVVAVDPQGREKRVIGERGRGPGQFNFPTGVALAGGELLVVDAMNFRIQTLTLDGRFVRMFGNLGNGNGTLNRPKGLAADTDGHLYVVDGLFEAVQVFDTDGRLLYYFGGGGNGPGQFALPAGIYIDPRNTIYVADSQNGRVQVFRYRRLEP